MLTLGTCIEALQAVGDGVVHALVETGFEMQAVEFRQAAPVAAIEAVATEQAEGHGHRARALFGQDYAYGCGHALSQQAEKCAGQVGRLPTHRVGVGVAGVNKIPLGFAQLMALQPLELDTLPCHLFALFAHLFALA